MPAFRLRVTKEEEEVGIDDVEIGEFAYDYVELTREVKPAGVDDVSEYEESIQEHEHERTHSEARMVPKDKELNSYQMQDMRRSPIERPSYNAY